MSRPRISKVSKTPLRRIILRVEKRETNRQGIIQNLRFLRSATVLGATVVGEVKAGVILI